MDRTEEAGLKVEFGTTWFGSPKTSGPATVQALS